VAGGKVPSKGFASTFGWQRELRRTETDSMPINTQLAIGSLYCVKMWLNLSKFSQSRNPFRKKSPSRRKLGRQPFFHEQKTSYLSIDPRPATLFLYI
jgi:hypothetical protein